MTLPVLLLKYIGTVSCEIKVWQRDSRSAVNKIPTNRPFSYIALEENREQDRSKAQSAENCGERKRL